MNTFLKKWRMENIKGQKIGKYLVYAIGEILLITIGVLIAVNINDRSTNKKHQILRCQYLEELDYTFAFDKKDVEENIAALEKWNPKLLALMDAIETDKTYELDSISDKINTIKQFIFFGQRTVTKMEELKYSSIDLIGNRNLKNNILLYQDENIAFLRNIERRYNLVDEEIRLYFSKHLHGGKATLEELTADQQFLSLIRQKYGENDRLKRIYSTILEKQIEIQALITNEIKDNCHQDKD